MLQDRQVTIATDNTTVVFYINKQGGGGYGFTLLRLVVDLFLHPKLVALIFELWDLPTVDMFTEIHNTKRLQSHHQAILVSGTGGGCSITILAKTVNVDASSVSLFEQSL